MHESNQIKSNQIKCKEKVIITLHVCFVEFISAFNESENEIDSFFSHLKHIGSVYYRHVTFVELKKTK
jgi:hypothetical protein